MERALTSIVERGHKRGLALLAAVAMNDNAASAFAAERFRAERVRAEALRERFPSVDYATIQRVLGAFDAYKIFLEQAPSIAEFVASTRLWRWARVRGSDYDDNVEMPDLFEVMAREMSLVPLQLGGLYMLDCSFVLASMQRTTFDDALVERCDFSNADLASTNWRGATIADCSFAGANLAGSCFDDATFVECDLRAANLRAGERAAKGASHVTFLDSDLRDTDWTRRVLDGTSFERCRMFGMHGRPVVRDVRIDAPDVSPRDHERAVGSREQVMAMWKRERQVN